MVAKDEEQEGPRDPAAGHQLVAADPILSKLLHYWRAKGAADRLPRRRDIDPAEIPDVLPHLLLIDAGDGGYRCRLCGTALAESYGRELTGKTFAEAFTPEGAARATAHCDLIRALRKPVVVHNEYANARGNKLVANRLLLPLADDEVVVNRILVGFRSHYPAQYRAPFAQPLFMSEGFVVPLV